MSHTICNGVSCQMTGMLVVHDENDVAGPGNLAEETRSSVRSGSLGLED